MLKEFKEFAMRGNVIELAIAVILGGAFGKIVTSLVNDIIMPPIGLLLSGIDFSNLFISLNGQPYASLADAQNAGAATINYGVFINVVIEFIIVAFTIFIFMRQINRWQKQPESEPEQPTTKDCPFCATTIPIKAQRCPNCTSELLKAT
jgi:large conductance mechanosensitive channel